MQNQNCSEVSLHSLVRMTQSKSQTIGVVEDMEKTKTSTAVDENVNWCSRCEAQYGDSLKFNNRAAYDVVTPGHIFRETLIQKIHLTVSLALFTIAELMETT